MIKIHYICQTCGASTNEKVSGSVMDQPSTIEQAKKRFPNIKCYYCDSDMEISNWVDSSGGSFLCNEPTHNFDKLKPEFHERFPPTDKNKSDSI